MNIFEKWSDLTPDDFVKLSKPEIEDLVFNYIVHLKMITEKTGKYQNSYPNLMAPIRLLLDQADILLNWRNIKRMFPERRALSNQLPYTTKHIQKMLSLVNCPRDIAFVHLMASSAIRVGGIYDLTCGDVNFIEDGAVITVYLNSTHEYRCCITPEATSALKDYLATRDNTSAIDPLLTVRNNSRKLSDGSIKDIMKRIKMKIPELQSDNNRADKNGFSANHAFRKRIEIVFSKTGIPESFNKYMTNHEMTIRIRNYFQGVSDKELWEQFQKAIPELTVDDTTRLRLKHEIDKKELSQKIPEKFKEKLELQDQQLHEMMLQLATAKYFGYETRYAECFGKANPDLKKLSKLMSNEEIDDWNGMIHFVQRKKDWTISKGSKSNEMLRDSKENKEILSLIKKFEGKKILKKPLNNSKRC